MNPETMPAVPMPPGGPIEIVFSFDTTGSMSSCLPQVRAQLSHVIERLNADIPGLRIAVFAHGDYCDRSNYVTKYIDFTNNVVDLCKFVQEVKATGGGDFEECYELVLRQVREELSWQPGTQKALVMIGDATPHGVKDSQNKDNIDWRLETKRLATETGVRIYAVQCLNNKRSDTFYEHLAKSTGGKHLKLDQLTNIVEMMMAVCYRERGVEYVEAFEEEVRQRNSGGMRADLERMFGTLKDKTDEGTPTPKTPTHKGIFATPPPTPGSSKSKKSTAGCRPRSDSVSSGESGSGASLGSTGSRKSRKTGTTVFTRSRAHPMNRRTKRLEDTPKGKRTNRKHILQSISKKCLEKVLRERTARKDFVLANLRWSHWREAMTARRPRANKQDWEDRSNDHPGVKRPSIFEDFTEPAVYEVGVQTPNCNQKVAVMASVTKGFHGRSWESGILSQSHVRSQVDRVLKKRCKLFIRRAKFTKDDLPAVYERSGLKALDKDSTAAKDVVKELRSLMTRTCDYAWKMHYDPESKKYTHRSLVKKGFVISE